MTRRWLWLFAGFFSMAGLCPASEAVAFHAGEVSDEKIHKLEQMHQRAEERILKNDFRGALGVYQDILLEEPDDETAYTGMAQCDMVLGDFSRAKEAYANALHINPDNEIANADLWKITNPDDNRGEFSSEN